MLDGTKRTGFRENWNFVLTCADVLRSAARDDDAELCVNRRRAIPAASATWLRTACGTNLTNQEYAASNNSGGFYAGPPRQFGIRLTKVF